MQERNEKGPRHRDTKQTEDLTPFDLSQVHDEEERKYQINTGSVFLDLKERWQAYDRTFLLREVQPALQSVLLKTGTVTYRKKEGEEQYFQRKERYYEEYEQTHGKEHFPFADYFISHDQLVDYSEPVILSREDPQFALFFALQLSLTPLMDVRSFLSFQYDKSFAEQKEFFEAFLHDLFWSYSTFLKEERKAIADDLLRTLPSGDGHKVWDPEKPGPIPEDPKATDHPAPGGYTTHQQCLAVYFLLKQVGVYNRQGEVVDDIQKKDIIALIHFLTGKNKDNIKKHLGNLFPAQSEAQTAESLRTIRPFFEKLKLASVIDDINRELGG